MIKFAKAEDAPQIAALNYQANLENEFPFTADFDKTLVALLKGVLEEVVLVKRNDSNPKLIDGVVCAKIDSVWWSSDPLLYAYFMYTKPEVRSFKLSRALILAAQEYAIINKIPLVFDLFAQKDVEKKKKLFKYLGFKEVGSLFCFNL